MTREEDYFEREQRREPVSHVRWHIEQVRLAGIDRRQRAIFRRAA